MENQRKPIRTLKRFCPIGKTYQDIDDKNCGLIHGEIENHILRKRWMLICSICEWGFFDKEDFDNHECEI
jgi:hypothetical protein